MSVKRLLHLITALTIGIVAVWLLTSSTAPLTTLPPAALAAVPSSPTLPHTYHPTYLTDTDWDSHLFYNRWKSGATTAPTLTLTQPNSATSWLISTPQQIRWNTNPPGGVPQVNLYYSADDFVTTDTITSSIANTSVYTWTTPPTPTTSAQVRIVSATSPTVRATSGYFTLYAPGTLTNTVYLPLVLGNYGASSSG
ncbi:MAG: hypothetical protein V3S14_12565, partial [Anaerolineae bacterium]